MPILSPISKQKLATSTLGCPIIQKVPEFSCPFWLPKLYPAGKYGSFDTHIAPFEPFPSISHNAQNAHFCLFGALWEIDGKGQNG